MLDNDRGATSTRFQIVQFSVICFASQIAKFISSLAVLDVTWSTDNADFHLAESVFFLLLFLQLVCTCLFNNCHQA